MAISGKYGNVEIPGIPDHEPVFILRAQDKLAPRMIERYWYAARVQGCGFAHLDGVEVEQARFLAWRQDHKAKLPDTKDPDAPEPGELPPPEAKVEDEPASQGRHSGSSPEPVTGG